MAAKCTRVNLSAFSTMTAQFSVPPRTISRLSVYVSQSRCRLRSHLPDRSNLDIMFLWNGKREKERERNGVLTWNSVWKTCTISGFFSLKLFCTSLIAVVLWICTVNSLPILWIQIGTYRGMTDRGFDMLMKNKEAESVLITYSFIICLRKIECSPNDCCSFAAMFISPFLDCRLSTDCILFKTDGRYGYLLLHYSKQN